MPVTPSQMSNSAKRSLHILSDMAPATSADTGAVDFTDNVDFWLSIPGGSYHPAKWLGIYGYCVNIDTITANGATITGRVGRNARSAPNDILGNGTALSPAIETLSTGDEFFFEFTTPIDLSAGPVILQIDRHEDSLITGTEASILLFGVMERIDSPTIKDNLVG